jgi:8-oxo-dGTP diphosphatase
MKKKAEGLNWAKPKNRQRAAYCLLLPAFCFLPSITWGHLTSKLLSSKLLTLLWGRLPLPRRVRTAIIWLLSPKFTVGVMGLVRDDAGRVLLLKHTYRPGNPWGLPGGGLRVNESLEDCIRREVREEANLRVQVVEMLSAAAHYDRRLVDMIFACRLCPGESLDTFKPNAEIAEARFFALDDLPADMSRSQRKLVLIAARQLAGDRSVRYEPELGEMP